MKKIYFSTDVVFSEKCPELPPSTIVPLISNVIEILFISWFSPENKLVKFIDPCSQKFLEYVKIMKILARGISPTLSA